MADDSKDRTLWCGNLHSETTEELLYELFVQAGPLEDVKIPNGKQFAFISFSHVESVPYALELMKGTSLNGHELRLQFRPGSVHEMNRGNGYHKNQRQQSQHGQGGMYSDPQAMMGVGMMQGMVMPPNMMGSPGTMMMGSPLRPPMAGMLMNTGFHRSYSTPEFGHMGQQGVMSGRQSSGGNKYQQGQGNYSEKGGRDSPSQFHQNQQRDRGGGGGGRDRDNYGGQRYGHSRSGRHDRSGSYDRHGGGSEDRNRKRRHDADQDNRYGDDRQDGRQGERKDRHRSREGRDRDQPNVQKQASQSFRRGLASPPWKKSVAPWEK